MPARSTVDDEIRALYHGPFADFIGARNALAKRLKKEGDARHAEVAALSKPSLSAWAVDQLFARESKAMAALVAAGERARAAQRRVEAGGDPKPLREALATITAETGRLAARGAELLAAAERAPGEAILERLRTNVEALALDPDAAPLAGRGWLDDDLTAPGFEVMAALQVAAMGARPAPAGKGKAKIAMAPPLARAPRPAAVPLVKPSAAASLAKPSVAATPTAKRGAAASPRVAPAPTPRPAATVHSFEDARAAAAERRQREAREREDRERGERLERLRAELERAEKEAIAQRREADRAAEAAATAAREAAETAKRARETKQSAVSAEAIAAKAREALARAVRAAISPP